MMIIECLVGSKRKNGGGRKGEWKGKKTRKRNERKRKERKAKKEWKHAVDRRRKGGERRGEGLMLHGYGRSHFTMCTFMNINIIKKKIQSCTWHSRSKVH